MPEEAFASTKVKLDGLTFFLKKEEVGIKPGALDFELDSLPLHQKHSVFEKVFLNCV